jgi:hypothetical protein
MTNSYQIPDRVRGAIQHYWQTLDQQGKSQGGGSGVARDRGSRSRVTGGKQLDGFVSLVTDLLTEAGVPHACVLRDSKLELPGYYRSQKQWDLLVVMDGKLLVTLELKSMAGSYGNNYNNRVEESLGNAEDYWTAYREGAFGESPRPWLGYLMLVGDSPKANRPVKPVEPHFKVFPEFRSASYINRFDILLTRLVRERRYDSTCLMVSPPTAITDGQYHEPNPQLSFLQFSAGLVAKVEAYLKTRR